MYMFMTTYSRLRRLRRISFSLARVCFALALPGFTPRRGCLRPRQGPRLGAFSAAFIGVLPVFAWARPPVTYRRSSPLCPLCMAVLALESIVFGLLALSLDMAPSLDDPCCSDAWQRPVPPSILWIFVLSVVASDRVCRA